MVVGIEGGFDTSECGSNEFPKATSNATSKFISADASKTQELIPETPPPSFAGALNQPPSDLLSYTCTVCLEIVDFLLTLVLDIKVHLWHWQPVFDTFVVKLEACYYSLHALLGGKG